MRQAKRYFVFELDSMTSAQPCEDASGSGHALVQTFSSTFRSLPQKDASSESHSSNVHTWDKGISFLQYFIVFMWLPCPTGLSGGITPLTKQCLLTSAPWLNRAADNCHGAAIWCRALLLPCRQEEGRSCSRKKGNRRPTLMGVTLGMKSTKELPYMLIKLKCWKFEQLLNG